jgi:hypothetical protein
VVEPGVYHGVALVAQLLAHVAGVTVQALCPPDLTFYYSGRDTGKCDCQDFTISFLQGTTSCIWAWLCKCPRDCRNRVMRVRVRRREALNDEAEG